MDEFCRILYEKWMNFVELDPSEDDRGEMV